MKKFLYNYIKRHNSEKGDAGAVLVIGVIILGVFLAGAVNSDNPKFSPMQGVMAPTPTNPPNFNPNSLQLKTIAFVTVTPPPVVQIQGNACQSAAFNDEQGILVGFDPGPNKSVSATGNIRVWVNDERPPLISPNEKVDPTTGAVTPGDRTATDGRGQGYYLWEPSIYITPLTGANANGPFSGDAEKGGKAYFPTIIKGNFNPQSGGASPLGRGLGGILGGINGGSQGPAIDADYTNFENGPDYTNQLGKASGFNSLFEQYVAEYIWPVSSLGLTPGSYRAEFVIHDGDINLAINCVSIQI